MNTNNPIQLVVKTSFLLKTGGRGRPVKGKPGDIFTVIAIEEEGNTLLTHKYRPNRHFLFTKAQIDEWFTAPEVK